MGRRHLVGLAEPEEYDKKYKQWLLSNLPIIPEHFRFAILDGAEQRFAVLKQLMTSKDVDEIINACDAGREGELIFRNIYAQTGSRKPTSRLWLSSYTQESIRDGFRKLKPETEYDDLGRAALARSEADWLVGINATRGLTRRNGSLVTIGRVQTPVLGLIAKREKEIQAFTPAPYYEIAANFKALPNGEPVYQGVWHRGSQTRLDDEHEAETILARCRGRKGRIASVEQKESRSPVPYLYDLGLLQREANVLNGLSASRTLRAAQALYEEKRAITYPRTDSKFLPKALRKEVAHILGEMSRDEYAPYVQHALQEGWSMRSFAFNDEKVTDHYAIIPTGTRVERKALTHDESIVYDLVVRRFIEQFYPEAVFLLTRVETVVQDETFGTDGRSGARQGLDGSRAWRGGRQGSARIDSGHGRRAFRMEVEHKLTKPPQHFTDASIIAAMETAGKLVDDEELAEAMRERGLGTPATRAEIIEKLIRTGVVERKARSLMATRRGIDLIDLLETIQLAELVAPDLTGDWEMNLRKIEKGALSDEEFLARIREFTRQMVDKIKAYEVVTQIGVESTEPLGVCPLCGGNVVERPASYACEHHGRKKTDCKFSIPKVILKRPLSREEASQLIREKRTDMLDGFVSRRGFKFSARLLLTADNKLEWEFANGPAGASAEEPVVNAEPLGRCPICQGSVIETSGHYKCAEAGCRFQMKKVYASKTIDRETVRKLLETGKTDLIEDFVSRYNRPFSAYLKLGDGGKVEFEFLNKQRATPRSGRAAAVGARGPRTGDGAHVATKTSAEKKGRGSFHVPPEKTPKKKSNRRGGTS